MADGAASRCGMIGVVCVRTGMVLYAVLLLLCCPGAMAASPLPLPAAVGASEKGDGDEASKDDLSEVRRELDRAKSDLASLEATLRKARPDPGSDSEEMLHQQRYLLREAVRAYEQALANRRRLTDLQQQMGDASRRAEAWMGLDVPPPYTVLYVDKLVEDLQAAENRLKAANAEHDSFVVFRDHVMSVIQANAAMIRQEEEARRGRDDASSGASGLLDLLRARARAQTAILKELESSGEILKIEVARSGIDVKLAERKLAATKEKVEFPAADYQRIRSELDIEARNASNAQLKLFGNAEAGKRTQEMARDEVLREGGVPAVSGGGMLDAFRLLPTVIELKRGAWELRYQLYNQRSPALLASASEQQRRYTRSLALFASNLQHQLSRSGEVAGRLESLLMSVETDALRQTLRAQLEDSVKRRKILQDTEATVSSAQFVVARLGEELGVSKSSMSLAEQAKTVVSKASGALATLWNFELFAAESTIEVDGRKVTGISSVTVGKVVRAILLMAIGIFIALWLARFAENYMVQRFGYDATRARILRKWLLALGLLVLVLVVLMWVNIPLSVFAFLGGAVAIGVGFGMQTLFKNLISGLMLLFEQPFKPGDLVQVGSIRGNITEVGIRSSVIRDANGIDTLIPNSVFLEENVTNWTYENPRVRFSIKVGVAYGSPAREVADILTECVKRHGLVLADPEPLVLFDDFGADALQFVVYYWVEIGPRVNTMQVASDIRFIVEKALSEKGIVISFPQRDVHLDAVSPLRVEVIRGDRRRENPAL